MASFREVVGPQDVVSGVLEGPLKAVVDVGLGGEMDDRVDGVLGEQVPHQIQVARVALYEFVAPATSDSRVHVGSPGRVVHRIDVYDERELVRGLVDVVAPDEPAPARDQNVRRFVFHCAAGNGIAS